MKRPLQGETSISPTASGLVPRAALVAHLSRPLLLLLPASVLLPVTIMLIGAWWGWNETWRAAERDLIHSADAAAEYAHRVLDGQRAAVDRVNDLLRGLSDDEIRAREQQLHQALRAMVPDLPQVQTAYVSDRNGRLLLSASVYPVPREPDFSDREFHRRLAAPDAPRVVVTRVYEGRVENNLFFAVARARRDTGNGLPPGSFDGQANVAVDPNVVGRGLARLLGEPQDSVTLVRADGHVLARHPSFARPLPQLAADGPIAAALAQGLERALVLTASRVDGVPRLIAIRRVPDWPGLYVGTGRPRGAIVQAWARGVLLELAVGVPTMLALWVLALLVVRSQRALSQVNDRLEHRVAERTAALAEGEQRIRLALSTAALGIVEWDLSDGVMRVDDAVEAISRGLLPAGRDLAIDGPERQAWLARIDPEDQRARDAQVAALRAGAVETIGGDYRVRLPGPDGADELVWITYRGGLVARETDRAPLARMIDVVQDVTERKRAEEALRGSEARLRLATEGAQVGIWELDFASGRGAWSAEARAILGTAAASFAGDGWQAAILAQDRAHVAAAWRAAIDSRSDYAQEFRAAAPAEDGGPRWVLARGRIEFGPDGTPRRALGVLLDVTARRRAEDQRELLMREVDHRAKNALSVMLAALRLTPRDDAASYARAVEGRAMALARAHTMLASGNWQGASLRPLVAAELAVFEPAPVTDGSGDGIGERVVIEGPDLMLPSAAAQPLAMALHELATNATKHGALSVPQGRLRVSWQIDQAAGMLHLTWLERGGPRLAGVPQRRGFGTQVLNATVRLQLDAELTLHWEEDGLRCEIAMKLPAPEPAAAPMVPAMPRPVMGPDADRERAGTP